MRVAFVLLMLCQLAHASPPGLTPEVAPAPQAPPPGVKSYRAQTLLADGIAAGLLVVAINENDESSEALAKLSLGTYMFGAPIVHLTKNRGSRALASMAMRIGFPIVGGFLGHSMRPKTTCDTYYDDYCEDDMPSDELVLGVIVGVIAASAVDAIYLAKGDEPKQQPPEPGWTPTARATQGGLALGVRATF